MGYRRNSAARDLILGRSHRIGIVSVRTPLFGPASLLFALERACHAAGYSLSVVPPTLEGDSCGIQRAVDELLDRQYGNRCCPLFDMLGNREGKGRVILRWL